MANRRRKPFSDITNITNTLIPTEALRKLVAATSSSNSFLKPPIFNSSSTNLKALSESSSKSGTSIGSSNVGAPLNSKKPVQFRRPSSVNPSIYTHGGIGSKDAADNRRQITEKSKKEREADIIDSHTPVEKKDKGKGIAAPLSSTPSVKTKDNQTGNEGVPKHSRSSSLKIKETGQELLNSSNFSVQSTKDKGKPLNTVNSHEKTRDKGKGPLDVIDSHTPVEKKDKGKGIAAPLSSTPSVKTKDNLIGNGGVPRHSRSSNLKIKETKETGQELFNFSSISVQSTKDRGAPLNTVNSHEKTREKGKGPLDIFKTAEEKGSSADVAVKSRPPTRKSEKRKFDAGASSSCPPMMRSKSIENTLTEAEDVKFLKSWTDPHRKFRKKTSSRIKRTNLAQDCNDKLPQDFVEQQRAYFKEVDEFELAEEEVSGDELD